MLLLLMNDHIIFLTMRSTVMPTSMSFPQYEKDLKSGLQQWIHGPETHIN